MRYTTFINDDQPHVGLVDGDHVIDLTAQVDGPKSLLDALRGGVDLAGVARSAMMTAAPRLAFEELTCAPLLPAPGLTICLGLNYFDHAKEGGRERPDYPWFFLRGAHSLIGHGAAGWVPKVSAKFDFEAELAVVIGSQVPRHVSAESALSYVFGYACFNDMSVRDFQKRTPQWTIGKNFDHSGAFGPMLVTADELPLGAAGLRIQGRLNGKVMQDANTSDMIFDVAQTISLLAEVLTLEPGDVIAMGTPAGVGQARTPPVWMADGDIYEVEIEGIGTLRNPISNEPLRTGSA